MTRLALRERPALPNIVVEFALTLEVLRRAGVAGCASAIAGDHITASKDVKASR